MPLDKDDLEKTFDQISGWMCKDIQAMIDGDANYSAALCILVYAEALGRIRNRTLGDPNTSKGLPAFEYFFDAMGYPPAKSETIYKQLRHGMAHSYVPNWRSNFIMEGGNVGFEIPNGNNVVVYVKKAFGEFKSAIPKVKKDITQPQEMAGVIGSLVSHPQFQGQVSLYGSLYSSSGRTISVNQSQP